MPARSSTTGTVSWEGTLTGETGTLAFGTALARAGLRRGTVHLAGELGTGKTTLVRGFLRAAGVTGTIRSPTFTLVEEYAFGETTVAHYDLYRLSDPEELEYLGLRDHLSADALLFFEWPERAAAILPAPTLDIRLAHVDKRPGPVDSELRRVRCVVSETGLRTPLERVFQSLE